MFEEERSTFSYSPRRIKDISRADIIENSISECLFMDLEMAKVSTNFQFSQKIVMALLVIISYYFLAKEHF